jgi:hypothetical protein
VAHILHLLEIEMTMAFNTYMEEVCYG